MNVVKTAIPDLQFIKELKNNGNGSFSKCYQCGTCSVACELAPDRQPFPRKEMLYANWGMKDKLLGNPDIWLCYNCGDCSTLCPRGAMPGETLSVIRKLAIREYSKFPFLYKLYNDPKLIPLQLFIPVIIIVCIGLVTGLLNLTPDKEPIVYANHFPVLLIEVIFIPLAAMVALIFYRGMKNMLSDMSDNYRQRGITDDIQMQSKELLKTFFSTLPTIFRHKDLGSCLKNRVRQKSHILVSFSFVGLALVAGVFVFTLYVLDMHGPYSQANPIKIFANIAGISLIIGSLMMIKDRMVQTTTGSYYFDWYLLTIVFLLGVTGMLTQFIRLAAWPQVAILIYFFHLVLAFNLIASLPFSKLAHFVYRTIAVTYCNYTGRK